MVKRGWLYLLIAVLIGTAAYWAVIISLGGLAGNPLRRLAVPPVWPVPPGAAAHPFWARFPALRGPDSPERRQAWEALLSFGRADLPHPAAKPAGWRLDQRIFAHALLWRLWRSRSFRAGGLDLRLDREENAPPPRVGEPARFRLSIVPAAGTARVRFPHDVDKLRVTGARFQCLTRPARRLNVVGVSPEDGDPEPAATDTVSVRRLVTLHAPVISATRLRESGRYSVRMVLDLTDAEIDDSRVPRGLWITNPLVLDVAPAVAE